VQTHPLFKGKDIPEPCGQRNHLDTATQKGYKRQPHKATSTKKERSASPSR
jgi:hypothetical protein